MSDFLYCIVHEQPPHPKITAWFWIRSWFWPVRGWTVGKASSPFADVADARAEWVIQRGKARPTSRVGMLHTCGTPSPCECNTDRQLKGNRNA